MFNRGIYAELPSDLQPPARVGAQRDVESLEGERKRFVRRRSPRGRGGSRFLTKRKGCSGLAEGTAHGMNMWLALKPGTLSRVRHPRPWCRSGFGAFQQLRPLLTRRGRPHSRARSRIQNPRPKVPAENGGRVPHKCKRRADPRLFSTRTLPTRCPRPFQPDQPLWPIS